MKISKNSIPYFVFPAVTLLFVGVAALLNSSSSNKVIKESNLDNYLNYISAYTTGEISRKSSIRIRLVDQGVEADQVGQEVDAPFSFSPSIKGSCKWIDTRTVEFIPEELLPSSAVFQGKFKLDNYFEEVPDSLSTFYFSFNTIQQSFDVELNGFTSTESNSIKWYKFDGNIATQDYATQENIESLVEVKLDGEIQEVEWKHDSTGYFHSFVIKKIERKEKEQKLTVTWNGKSIDVNKKGDMDFILKSLSDFSFTRLMSYSNPEQYITVEYSDPLDRKQNLDGLIKLSGYNFNYVIDANKIKIYPTNRIHGDIQLTIEKGVKNIMGYASSEKVNQTLNFIQLKPEVKLASDKTIIPTKNDKIPFVFEAVSLNKVDIRIIKIFEDNVPQFLQRNQLKQNNELQRVGHVIHEGVIDLEGNKKINLENWNRHQVDLAKYIKADPGAIYEVAIGFRKAYSLYDCVGDEEEEQGEDLGMLQVRNWDKPNQYESSYWDGYYYSYRDRDNPCRLAYYKRSRSIRQNILASNLGIIAKKGNNGEMLLVATDIRSARSLEGVTLEVYDYQQQLIAKATSNAEGMASVKLESKPFLVIAKKGKSRGYLRVDDGNSLSLSRFEVSGVRKFKGLNGFFYGERGVWRPGDSLFITFILEDKLNTLPENHPVVFELKNPLGQVIEEQSIVANINGFYKYHTATSDDAQTGNYTLKAKVGGTRFSKSLKIETIVPNRLKINIDFGKESLTEVDINTEVKLNSKWLHGAPASKLKSKVDVILTQATTSFKKFSEFVFDDPSIRFSPEEQVVYEGVLDEDGNTSFKLNIETNEQAPGKLKANFKTRVFEKSGNFSVDRVSIDYHPFDYYVGIRSPKGDKARGMLLTDTSHTIQFVTTNTEGEAVGNKKLDIEVYKLGWKWWWDASVNQVNYNSTRHRTPVLEGNAFTNSKGEGSWKLRIDYPEWGRYLIRTCSDGGHCAGKIVFIDWPGWAGKPQRDGGAGASMLTFETDKPSYNIGDKIKVSIPSTKGSRLLVTVENSDRVLHAEWVEGKDKSTTVTLDALPNMSPNAYIHVTLVHPHQHTKSDAPIRLYGVVPVTIVDPGTLLHPEIKMANILRPNKKASITVSEKDQKAMTFTVAVVDEGLLDLTRFKTPDPWSHFHKKQALGVKTWDLFDEIISLKNMQAESILAIGGDMEGKGPDGGKKQNRFKPLVKFFGPFHLNDDESKNIEFMMPNYVGSARTMVVAGYDGAYGHTEKTTPVKEDLMVLGTLPRVLGPGESLKLPVTVFAMADEVQQVNIKVKGSNILKFTGATSKTISTPKQGEYIAEFDLEVAEYVGNGNIQIEVSSGNKKARWETDIEIRTPNPRVVNSYEEKIVGSKTVNYAFDPVGLKGTNKATIEVSTIPPLNLGERLDYLIRYPYGCVEQTTSSVFPQLYLSKLLKLPKAKQREIEGNIRKGIERLHRFQRSNGGLSYWPGSGGNINEWGTNYAGHFMLAAEKAGYTLPKDFKHKWIKYQKNAAINTNGSERYHYYNQAYRLFLLAYAGEPDLASMNKLRVDSSTPKVAKWYLAAAYQLAGQPEIAKKITKNLSKTIADYTELSYTYGSGLRDRAIVLQCLSILGRDSDAADMMKKISEQLNSNKWYSTQTTAYSLLAIASYVGETDVKKNMQFEYRVNGGNWTQVSTTDPLWQNDYNIKKEVGQKIEIRNKSTNVLFTKVISEGIPLKGDDVDASNGLQLYAEYRDTDGTVIDPRNIKQGTDFKVTLTLKNTSNKHLKEMAIHQIFPSGWQVQNARLDNRQSTGDRPTYQDFRDDRVYTFYDLRSGNSKSFTIYLNASFKGKYYLPTVYTEAMYDKTINARRHGQWIEVQ